MDNTNYDSEYESVENEDFDAFNDETFGDAIEEFDWDSELSKYENDASVIKDQPYDFVDKCEFERWLEPTVTPKQEPVTNDDTNGNYKYDLLTNGLLRNYEHSSEGYTLFPSCPSRADHKEDDLEISDSSLTIAKPLKKEVIYSASDLEKKWIGEATSSTSTTSSVKSVDKVQELLEMLSVSSDVAQDDEDEYNKLMTERERYWLAGVQLLQINSMEPFIDDYYFTIYQHRHSRKNQIQKDHVKYTNNQRKEYLPLQFENSLGKVQFGSITAPRKALDIENPSVTPNVVSGECKRHILLRIENMYTELLEIETHLYNKKKNPEDDTNTDELIEDLYKKLIKSKQEFLTYMSIRKGKRFVLRFLAYHKNPLEIFNMIVENIELITLRDCNDCMLLSFLPHFRSWVANAALNQLNSLIGSFVLFQNEFIVSILSNMVEQAENVFDMSEKKEQMDWLDFIEKIAITFRGIKLKPVVCVQYDVLRTHLRRCKNIKKQDENHFINIFTKSVYYQK